MKTDAPKAALKQTRAKPQHQPAAAKVPTASQPVEIHHPNIEEGMSSVPKRDPAKRPWLKREDWLAKRRQHEGEFDVGKHGYWRTKNGLVYRHPDGREIGGATGVDDFE